MNEETKTDRIKRHFAENKKFYYGVGISMGLAGISLAIVKLNLTPIDRGTSVIAQNGISVLGKKVVMENVSYISANRQGPPSWVIRCVETGEIYTSQNAAAMEMSLSGSEISKHLNGLMDHVRGYHFERICMAA